MLRHLTILLFATSCAIISEEEHLQRIHALNAGDTDTDSNPDTDDYPPHDTDTDTDTPPSPPEIHEGKVSFRFNALNLYDGLQLALQITDPNGDLVGGNIEIQGAETIPWSAVEPRADNWYLVPIHTQLGPLCSDVNSKVLEVVVTDGSGHPSPVTFVTADWAYRAHNESGYQSADACEPCVSGLVPTDMPLIVCGNKGVHDGFVDFADVIEMVVPQGTPPFEVTANYRHSNNLRLGLNYPPDFHFIDAVDTNNDYGQTLHVVPPSNNQVHQFSVDSTSTFNEGDWILFFQPELPALDSQ